MLSIGRRMRKQNEALTVKAIASLFFERQFLDDLFHVPSPQADLFEEALPALRQWAGQAVYLSGGPPRTFPLHPQPTVETTRTS